jgi:hypothetical protein
MLPIHNVRLSKASADMVLPVGKMPTTAAPPAKEKRVLSPKLLRDDKDSVSLIK